MSKLPTIAEIDREIAELETWLAYLEQSALQHGVLNRVGRDRIAQLEQQRADLGLRESGATLADGKPYDWRNDRSGVTNPEWYGEPRPLTQAELAPVVSGVSGANDYTDAIPARLDHNQP